MHDEFLMAHLNLAATEQNEMQNVSVSINYIAASSCLQAMESNENFFFQIKRQKQRLAK